MPDEKPKANELASVNDAAIAGWMSHEQRDRVMDGVIRGKAGHILRQTARTSEPVFILRARDLLSIFALKAYVEAVEDYLPIDMDMQKQVVDGLNEFRRWQHDHPSEVRFPD